MKLLLLLLLLFTFGLTLLSITSCDRHTNIINDLSIYGFDVLFKGVFSLFNIPIFVSMTQLGSCVRKETQEALYPVLNFRLVSQNNPRYYVSFMTFTFSYLQLPDFIFWMKKKKSQLIWSTKSLARLVYNNVTR